MDALKIVMIAAEAVPFAKAGGLADVVGALPIELERLGAGVSVVMPRYGSIDLGRYGFAPYDPFPRGETVVGPDRVPFDVHCGTIPRSNVRAFLIGNDTYFGRAGIYVDPDTGVDYPDQVDRWIFFQRAAVEFLRAALPGVNIVHCHDHQTGLVPAYVQRDGGLRQAGSVFTIHNMGYQGLFSRDTLLRAGFAGHDFYPGSPFEFFGSVNFMKAGIALADLITTVSETYAREISHSREFGYGLEGVVAARGADVMGILNGIDTEEWNPATDPLIAAHYSASDLAGKRENKRLLLEEFRFPNPNLDRPVLAMVSRIDVQKGFDLVAPSLESILKEDVYFVMIGTGNKQTETALGAIAARHPERAGMVFAYDNAMAHRIEAGADIFLMPSRYEPCGLSQLYSMRYGTVPVVRTTGGLADTVPEFDPDAGTGMGFRFGRYETDALMWAIRRALSFWQKPDVWRTIMVNGMTADFSWAASARRYLDAYHRVTRRRAVGV
ncbi:MAG TPA: glycogen synthase GlgA [Terriglobia bacterium]|nr:glycogen synthase GlgA [Terriglobia bacterium]